MAAQELKMTSPIGKRKNKAGAFTLVELMLVMALLIIVIAVAAPSLSGFFRGRNLDSEARRFLSLTRYGQSRAVSEGVPMVLWIDAQNGQYGLQTQTGYTDNDAKAVQFALDDKLTMEVSMNQIPTMTRSNTWTQNAPAPGVLPVIRFLPDGFIDEASPENILIRESLNNAIVVRESTNRLRYEIESTQTAQR